MFFIHGRDAGSKDKQKLLKIYVFSSFRYNRCHRFFYVNRVFRLIFQSSSYSCHLPLKLPAEALVTVQLFSEGRAISQLVLFVSIRMGTVEIRILMEFNTAAIIYS